MEELKTEQTEITTQPAEAEKESGVTEDTVSLKKFKDVNALLNAYNSLEAEFTKRCQRIKELEAQVQKDKTEVPLSTESSVGGENAQGISDKDKEEVLKDYLKNVLSAKQKAVIMDGLGFGVVAPKNRPTTITQAGKLAKEIL